MATIEVVVTKKEENKSSIPVFDSKGNFVEMKDTVTYGITLEPKRDDEQMEKKTGKTDNEMEEEAKNIFADPYPYFTLELKGVKASFADQYEVNDVCVIEVKKPVEKEDE